MLGVVVEAESDGVVDGDVVELGGVDEADLGGFVADGQCAAGGSGEVGDGELLPHLAHRGSVALLFSALSHIRW